MRISILPFCVLIFSLFSSQAMAQIFSCDSSDGHKIFSSKPCGNNSRQISNEELTPNSGGNLGASSQRNQLPNHNSQTSTTNNQRNLRSFDSQLITSRYDELSRIVTRLVGVENSKSLQQRISANKVRALRATSMNANTSQINARFDAELEDIRRIHLGNNSRMASEWIRVEAERDTALFGLTPAPSSQTRHKTARSNNNHTHPSQPRQQGVVIDNHGNVYVPSGNGIVDPRDGTYLNRVPGGFINSRDGSFLPSN